MTRSEQADLARGAADIALSDAIRAIAAGRRDDTAKAFGRYVAWVGREAQLSARLAGPILNAGDREAGERV